MAESRRRSSILKKQDTCIIEGTDGNTRVARTPRRVSFAQTLTLREFECHEYNGSNTDESSSREDVSSGEVFQSCSAPTTQRGFEISPNTSLMEFLATSPENQPGMIVEAHKHDSESIATDTAMAAFINESRLNQTVLFSNMDDSACGMDITANISQLPESSFAEVDGVSASQVEGRQQSKPGFHRRPSFSNDFCDGVFIKRYPKLLDDLFKLGKSSQAPSNQVAVVKEKPPAGMKLYDDREDTEVIGVFSEESKRKALNDITRHGMLTPIEEISVLSRNVSLADPDLVAGNKFYGNLVPAHLHQVYMKLDRLKNELETECPIDKENIPVIPFPGQSIIFKESVVDTSSYSGVRSGDPARKDMAEFSEEKKQAGFKLFQNESKIREKLGSNSDMELTSSCTKITLMGRGLPHPTSGAFLMENEPNETRAIENLEGKTLYMEDGGDMELTSICTRTIHLEPDLSPPKDHSKNTWPFNQIGKTSIDKKDQSGGQTVYMVDGGDMELTSVFTETIHMGPHLKYDPQNKHNSVGLQERERLKNQTLYMADGEDMEFTNVCTKTIQVGPNLPLLIDNSSSHKSLATDQFKGQTVYMKDGEDMELTNVCTKTIHMGHNLIDHTQSKNTSIALQENKLTSEKMLNSQTVYMKDGEDMELTNVCTKTIHMGHNLIDHSQSKNTSKCLLERELTDEKILKGQTVYMGDGEDMEFTRFCTKTIHMGSNLPPLNDNSSSCKNIAHDKFESQTVYLGNGEDMEITGICTKTFHVGHNLQPTAHNASISGAVLQDIKSTDNLVSKKVEVLEGTKSALKEPRKHQEPIMVFDHLQHLAGPQVTQTRSCKAGQCINSSHAGSFVSKLQLTSEPAVSLKNSVTVDNDRDGTKTSGKVAEYSFKRSSQESLSDDPACKRPKNEIEVTPSGIAALDKSLTFPKQMGSVPSAYQSRPYSEASVSVPPADCDPMPNHEKSRPTAEACPEKDSLSTGVAQDQQKTTLRQDLTRSLLKDLQFPLMLTRPSASRSSAPFQKRRSCNFNLLLQPKIPNQPSCPERLYRTANSSGCNPQVENEAMPLGGEISSENNNMTPMLNITGTSRNSLIFPPYPMSRSVSSLTGSSTVSFSQHESPDKCLKKSGSSVLALSPLPDIWDPFEVEDNGQLDLSQCDSLEMINNQTMPELAEDADSETELSKTPGENLSSKLLEQGHQTTVPKPVTFSDLMEELGVEFGGDVPIKQASVKPIPLSTVEEKLMAKLIHAPKAETLENFIKELTLTVSRSKQACESMLSAFPHQLPASLQAAIQAKREGIDPSSLKLKAQETAEACRISARAKWKRHKADHLQKYTSAREAAQEGLSREVGEVLKDTEKLMDLMGDIDQCLQEVDVLTSQQRVLEAEENKLKEIESETAQLKIQCDDMANKVSSLQEDNQEALKRIAVAKKEVEAVEDKITWMHSLTEWSLLDNTETQMDFGFLFGTIALQVKLTSPREEILEVALKSRIGEQSRPWAKFVHNLAMSSIDCDTLMRSYKDYSQLRLLLNDVSLVSLNCRLLVDELKLIHLQHHLTLTENRVTIVMKNREVLCKLQLDTEIKPNTYPDTPLHWTIVPLIGTICLEDVKSAVNQVPGGYKYIERTLAAASRCLTGKK